MSTQSNNLLKAILSVLVFGFVLLVVPLGIFVVIVAKFLKGLNLEQLLQSVNWLRLAINTGTKLAHTITNARDTDHS